MSLPALFPLTAIEDMGDYEDIREVYESLTRHMRDEALEMVIHWGHNNLTDLYQRSSYLTALDRAVAYLSLIIAAPLTELNRARPQWERTRAFWLAQAETIRAGVLPPELAV